MQKLRRAYRVALVLFILFLLIMGGLVVYVMTPNPVIITDTVGQASIRFETQNNRLFDETGCYTVSWQVSEIEGVYLNESGKIGQGEESLCYTEVEQPELRVVFEDGSDTIYPIEIQVIQEMENFWIAVGVATLTFFLSLYFLIFPSLGMTLRNQRATLSTIVNLVLLTVITLVVVGGMLEVGMRFYFTNYGTEDEKISYVYTSQEIQQQTAQLVGAPYTTYLLNPNHGDHTPFGYRGETVPIESDSEDVFHIVAVGASTTYGFGLKFNEAYPFILENILHNKYGLTHVEVTNAGVPGYTSYELLTNFQFRILEIEPDLLIYYGAKNDADTRFEDPGCYNDFSPLYGLTTFHGLWKTQFDELPSSVLYRYFAINTGLMGIPTSLEFALDEVPLAEECRADDTYTEEELLELNQPIFAERNMRNFLALAQFHDIDVAMAELVHPTAPSHINQGEEALIMSVPRAQAVAEVNSLYQQIAEEMNVPYLATSENFVIEPGMFWTEVHMTFEGTRQLAELYAVFLVENDLISPAPESD